MRATKFRVRNFRNIDDSGWIPLEQVTAFVGRNESGKTAILKALHKFNPGSPEPYDPQRDFPRDRYTRDFVASSSISKDWPVCSVQFEIDEALAAKISDLLPVGIDAPTSVKVTRFYSGKLEITYLPTLPSAAVSPAAVIAALETFASDARRLEATEAQTEDAAKAQRAELVRWTDEWISKLQIDDLRSDTGTEMLSQLTQETDAKSSPWTADVVEGLRAAIDPVLEQSKGESWSDRIDALLESVLPVFIYFEDYGVLHSAIWLPRFVEDLQRDATVPQIRTANAMFRHVGLDPQQISELGQLHSSRMHRQGQTPSPEQIADDQRLMDERAILLNAASQDISQKFSEWWSQRRHSIRYHADADYFRVWIADDRRPNMEIELVSRSKGFQWFFSFYLVFLVESDDGHKDAILLLDEPGLHLHPTAQQELITFFEELAKTNQVFYTTHSPFLIDGEHLHRIRAVTEDETGHSSVSADSWPEDRETIFPLQAAAGYAIIKGLFAHRSNVLVEGMSDFFYLHSLSQQCAATGRTFLLEDIYLTPCGGTKYMGTMAALFLGHEVRPLVLLDSDDAGVSRQKALLKGLYSGHDRAVLMLDEVLGRSGDEVEIEDLLGPEVILNAIESVTGHRLSIDTNNTSDSLPTKVEAAATGADIELPVLWKGVIAQYLVSAWAEQAATLPEPILDRASLLFEEMNQRLQETSLAGQRVDM